MIINEAKELVANGFKEITLLGQNVNSYGKGLEPKVTFADLVKELDKIKGEFRMRFMTSHPKDCSRELIDIFVTIYIFPCKVVTIQYLK